MLVVVVELVVAVVISEIDVVVKETKEVEVVVLTFS